MKRSRVGLLSLAAALLVAAPALAFSWTALLALPAVFGQEPARPQAGVDPVRAQAVDSDQEFKDLLVQVQGTQPGSLLFGTGINSDAGLTGPVIVPAVVQAPKCLLTDDCMTSWQALWQQGRYAEALRLARRALQTAPESLAVQHAFVVSQIVTQARFPAPVAMPVPLFWTGPLPAGTFTPDLDVPLPVTPGVTPAGSLTPDLLIPSRVSLDVDIKLPTECPLAAFFETLFGACKETKCCPAGACPVGKACCAQVKDGCRQAVGGTCSDRQGRGQHPVTVIWIVREPAMSIPLGAMHPLPPPPVPQAATAPLPPPFLAPPPPPFVSADELLRAIPLPVPTLPPEPQLLRIEAQRFDGAEQCEEPPMIRLPNVRITQQGQHVHLSSPNWDAHCERLRGNGSGGLMLEGKVLLVSRRHGQSMAISAERVLLNVKDDSFVVEQAEGMDSSRVNIAPVSQYVRPSQDEWECPPPARTTRP